MQVPDVPTPPQGSTRRAWTDDQKLMDIVESWPDTLHEHLPGASPSVVSYALDRLAATRRSLLTLKSRAERWGRMCPGCNEPFTPIRSTGVYCSSACRQRAYRRRNAIQG